jgi:hypothetical protein
VNVDAKVLGNARQGTTDVSGCAEPELAAVGQPCSERFRDQQAARAVARRDAGGFVDHEHGSGHRQWSDSVIVSVAAAYQAILHQVSVERGLELVGEVASGDATEDLWIGVCETRVARSASTATFLEQFLSNRHRPIVPPMPVRLDLEGSRPGLK